MYKIAIWLQIYEVVRSDERYHAIAGSADVSARAINDRLNFATLCTAFTSSGRSLPNERVASLTLRSHSLPYFHSTLSLSLTLSFSTPLATLSRKLLFLVSLMLFGNFAFGSVPRHRQFLSFLHILVASWHRSIRNKVAQKCACHGTFSRIHLHGNSMAHAINAKRCLRALRFVF